jgi:hypothetical protein
MKVVMPKERQQFYIFKDRVYYRNIEVRFRWFWKLLSFQASRQARYEITPQGEIIRVPVDVNGFINRYLFS